ncbi:MAG: MMPL family transporter [Bacteroidetes bacterium]|nr:MMPL family transporter [Bacteroidota bacterium]
MNGTKFYSRLEKFVNGYVDWVLKYRWLVVVGTIVVTIFIASGARFLRFDTNYRAFFSDDNPQLQLFEEIQNVYSKNDNILFVLGTQDDNVFKNQTMAAIEKLTKESWQIPYSTRVDAITNFQHTHANGDDLIVEDLIENALQKSSEELKNAKVIALSEPFLIKQLISESAHVTGVNVTLQFPEESITEVPEAVAFARNLANQISEEYPDIEIHITGMAMLNNAFSEASMSDMQSLIPLMYVVMLLIMLFSLRSVTGTIATLFIITFSTIVAMGLAGWFGTGITPPSAQAPTIIMTLAIADSIHILISMFGEMRRGRTKLEAIKESMRINFLPVFLTSISTIIGFLTMNFSDVPPFNDLGNITSTGIAAAFFLSVIFLPAFMAIMPVKVKKRKEERKDSVIVDAIAEFVIRRRQPLFYGGIITAIVIGAFVFTNELNDNYVEYFDENIQFRTDTDYAAENLTGIYQVQYSLGADGSGGISDPDYLAKLEEFTLWYRSQPKVVHVNTFTDVIKRLNKNMHGDDPSYYRVPENRELAAQYLLLYEMSLPFGLDLNNRINIDKSATRFIITLEDVTAEDIKQVAANGEQWLKENAPDYMFSYGSGPSVMFANITGKQINSMIKGTLIALVLISFMMIFALRNLKIGLISLIPNLMPAMIGFGLWGIMVGRVDAGLSIVMGMTLGIVVDDTVHFLSKYLRARRERNLSPDDAIRYAFHTVGKALIVTTFIISAGFFILSFSSFAMNSNMSKLTTIVIGIALLADFLFLPTLLMKLEGVKPSITEKEEDISAEPVPVEIK